MKKKIKDLTEQELLDICKNYNDCDFCSLALRGGRDCQRRNDLHEYLDKGILPNDLIELYLNKEVELVKEEDLPSEDVAYFKKHCVR